ncbi:MAG: cupin domain-containing protein [Halopseudomonas sabulinigri]
MSGNYPDKIRTLPLYDGRFDAYKLAAEGADVLFASYPAGTKIPAHTHDTDNYGVVIRGEIILTVAGKTRHYGVGDWYHVAAHVEHAAAFDQPTDEIEFWFSEITR